MQNIVDGVVGDTPEDKEVGKKCRRSWKWGSGCLAVDAAGGKAGYSMEPGTMVGLLTDSDDWSQSRSVVAHLQYSVVTSGEDACLDRET